MNYPGCSAKSTARKGGPVSRRLGEYVPLSVDYADDDAVIACTPMAELLFIRCLALARRLRSDGYLTEAQLVNGAAPQLGPRRPAAALPDALPSSGPPQRNRPRPLSRGVAVALTESLGVARGPQLRSR